MDLVRGDHPGEDIGLRLLAGGGFHLDSAFVGGSDHIGAEIIQGLQQLCGGQAAQILIGVELEPQHQGLLGAYGLGLRLHALKGMGEIVEPGIEGSSLVLGPFLTGLFADELQEFAVIAGTGEPGDIEFGVFVVVQELIVGPDPGIIGLRGQDPLDVAGDPGRAEIAQDGHPLVALLDIEIAHVFKALNGLPDALVAQMGGAELLPFGGELAAVAEQGQEGGRKGGDPPGGLGAHDPLCRDLHQAHFQGRIKIGGAQNIIQNRRVGIFSGGNQFLGFFQTLFHRLGIFFHGFRCNHSQKPPVSKVLHIYHSGYS